MEHRRKLAVLGSTGSIGRQTLDIAAEYPGLFEVEVLVANRSAELLIEQARRHKPSHVVIASEDLYPQVAQALSGTGIEVHTGSDIVSELVALPQVDTVVTAMVGLAALVVAAAAQVAQPTKGRHKDLVALAAKAVPVDMAPTDALLFITEVKIYGI